MSKKKESTLTRAEKSWILYDVGNSAYTMIACSLIPIWFKAIAIGTAPGQITSDQATAFWALGASVVTILVALLGPIIGAFADYKDRKKVMFTTTLAVGVIGCLINGLITGWFLFLLVFILTKTAYASSQVIYDGMLNDITEQDRMDEVSSYGYAWGYIGSCAPFLVALIAYVLGPDMVGILPDLVSKLIGFGVTAIWWFATTVPLLKHYRQRYYTEARKGTSGAVFRQIGSSIRRIAVNDRKVLWFLIAFFLYIDGVGTIIDNCINVGTDLGLNTVGQVITLLATQVVAFAFSMLFARLSRKHRTVTLLRVCIIGYFFVCLYALTLKNLLGFGILAFGIGMFQGSIQSLSRSYFSRIIPPENSGEYFGIYDIFCKGASFLGSAVLGGVKLMGGTINIALASLALFFALGYVFLSIADKTPSKLNAG